MWNRLLSCGGFALFFPIIAFPQERFPWSKVHPSNVKIFDNATIETKFRLSLLRKAVKTIDMITFDQRGDEEVSLPLLQALRFAANRNVKVRFLRGSYLSKVTTPVLEALRKMEKEPHSSSRISYLKNFTSQLVAEIKNGDPVEKTLVFPPTITPIEYQLVGDSSMTLRGWSPLIGAHEKLIIIDNQIVIMGGRGQTVGYLNWEDNCHVIKGEEFGLQAKEIFEELWNTVNQSKGILTSSTETPQKEPPVQPLPFFTQDPSLPLNPKQKKKLHLLKQWSKIPALDASNVPTHQQYWVRLIHHDLLAQIKRHCGVYWLYEYHPCMKKVEDPIIQRMIELVNVAQDVKFYTLSLQLHPDLKKALLSRLNEKKEFDQGKTGARNFSLTLLTNGKEAHHEVIPYPMGWYAGLEDLNHLMQAGANAYTFGKNSEKNSLVYLHRKGAIFTLPNREKFYISGSHNMSQASTYINDELAVEFMNSNLVDHEIIRFEKSIAQNGTLLNLDDIQSQDENNRMSFPFTWFWNLALHLSKSFF